MKKRKNKYDSVLKWWKQVLVSIIVVPALAFGWKNCQLVWKSPIAIADVSEKVSKVESKVDKQTTAQEQVAMLLLEEKSRNDKQDAVYQAQMESVKEQLKLIAELKKK